MKDQTCIRQWSKNQTLCQQKQKQFYSEENKYDILPNEIVFIYKYSCYQNKSLFP